MSSYSKMPGAKLTFIELHRDFFSFMRVLNRDPVTSCQAAIKPQTMAWDSKHTHTHTHTHTHRLLIVLSFIDAQGVGA